MAHYLMIEKEIDDNKLTELLEYVKNTYDIDIKVIDKTNIDTSLNSYINFIEVYRRKNVDIKFLKFIIINKIFQDYLNITLIDIRAKSKEVNISWIRHLYIYYLYNYVGYPSTRLGRIIKRDHATILASLSKDECYNPPPVYVNGKKVIDEIIKDINNYINTISTNEKDVDNIVNEINRFLKEKITNTVLHELVNIITKKILENKPIKT